MKKILFLLFLVIASATMLIYLFPDADTKNSDKKSPDKTLSQIEEKIIDVPVLCQYPELPTGCESVAAAMVLQYYNVDVKAEEFAREWLECSEYFYSSDDKLYGPDPSEVFAGDPFSAKSYGCYAPPIVRAINHNSLECEATAITDKSLEELCALYIDEDKPILIWATMGMKESTEGKSWYLEDGNKFTWIAGEHCLVLIGYNEAYYFLNDPQSGSTVAYQKNIVERRFRELGAQAVYITNQ